MTDKKIPWMVSLHGGHSGQFCDHATGSLREVVEAAATQGFRVFGVTEHASRIEERFLYAEEIELGWDLAKLARDFEIYAETLGVLAEEFADRLTILRGFELEVVPADRYVEVMRGFRERFGFDYVVGSVHYVDEMHIDCTPELFAYAMEVLGGIEPLVVRYYETIAEMIQALQPEVLGHLDVIRKFGQAHGPLDTPSIRRAAETALEAAREAGTIIDVNTGAYRRGAAVPYPDVWLVEMARRMEIPFCFGDDSHGPQDVGTGLERARAYLLENGVNAITILEREGGDLVRRAVPLT